MSIPRVPDWLLPTTTVVLLAFVLAVLVFDLKPTLCAVAMVGSVFAVHCVAILGGPRGVGK